MERESDQVVRLEQGEYAMLLQPQIAATTEGTIYFSIPGQTHYLYEYEGDLEEVLGDLPQIYEEAEISVQTLNPQAAIVVGQLWDYFDRTGEQHLEGQHEYNFQTDGNRLLILPKDGSAEMVAVARDGQIESSFAPSQFEHLMERFAIAYEQIQLAQTQQRESQEWERG